MKMRDIHKEEGRMVVSTAYDKLRQSMDVVCIVHHPGIVATLEIIEDDMVDDFYVGALPQCVVIAALTYLPAVTSSPDASALLCPLYPGTPCYLAIRLYCIFVVVRLRACAWSTTPRRHTSAQ